MALSLSELTSQRPLFKHFDGVVIACVLVCYTPLLFVAANPVLYYFISMLCVLSCIDDAGTRQHKQHGYKVVQNRTGRYKQQRRIAHKHTNTQQ
jgi:hypothetical protein